MLVSGHTSSKTTATTFAVAVIIIDFRLRQYPPVTKVQQIAIFQNGEFETAPRRQARMLGSGHTKSLQDAATQMTAIIRCEHHGFP